MESEEICATLQDLATEYNLPNYHINHHYSAQNGNELDVHEVEEVTEDIHLNNSSLLEETVSEEAMDLELQTITPMPQMDVNDEVHEPSPYKSTTEEDLMLSHPLENIDQVQFEIPQSQNLVQSLDIPPQGKNFNLCFKCYNTDYVNLA